MCEQLWEQFGGCNFSSRNILQLKQTLEVWHSVPQDTVYRIIPKFASNLLRLHTVKSRAAHCWNKTVAFRRCYWIIVVFVTFAIFIWHVVDQFLHEISPYALFTCCLASFLTSYQYFVTTKRKVTSEWKICLSNIFAPLNFLSSVVILLCLYISMNSLNDFHLLFNLCHPSLQEMPEDICWVK